MFKCCSRRYAGQEETDKYNSRGATKSASHGSTNNAKSKSD